MENCVLSRGGTEDDPDEDKREAGDQAHDTQDEREIVMLSHHLQLSRGLGLLGVDGEKDGRDGAEEAYPAETDAHHTGGDEGQHEAVVVRAIAASVDRRRDGVRLLLDYHHVRAGLLLRRLGCSGRLVGRRSTSVALLRGGSPAGEDSRVVGAGSLEGVAGEGSRIAGVGSLAGEVGRLRPCRRLDREQRLDPPSLLRGKM